jgi:hypothetical protein
MRVRPAPCACFGPQINKSFIDKEQTLKTKQTIFNAALRCTLALGLAMSVTSCANLTSQPSASSNADVQAASAVPKLDIELRCGDCTLTDQNKAAIREAFEQQFRATNTKACARDRVTITIDELNQQSFALLMVLGPGALLFSDKAKATVQTCAGANAVVEASVRRPPPFRTTNSLMADLGAQVAKALAP